MADSRSPDISQITEYLYISAWPRGEHAEEIVDLGVRLILSMHWLRPQKNLGNPPMRLLWLPTIDNPVFPMPMRKLKIGVQTALPVIQDGGAVLVHCKAGVHRSVAMAACIMIGRGYDADDAMWLIKEKRAVADPDVWYIQNRIRKFEQQWLDLKHQSDVAGQDDR